mgnify:CR=1 FL=1
MISKLKEDWIKDEELKHWNSKGCLDKTDCNCNNPNLIELQEQDSCIRGRIDTVICKDCNQVKSFKIIR